MSSTHGRSFDLLHLLHLSLSQRIESLSLYTVNIVDNNRPTIVLLDTRFPDHYLFQSSSKITFLNFEIVDIVNNSFKSNLFYLSIL